MEFAATSYTVSEGAEFVTLEVVKWGETTNEIILNFTLGMEGDSAEGMEERAIGISVCREGHVCTKCTAGPPPVRTTLL